MEKGLISVDAFTSPASAYFLTHLHSDHTVGLSATFSSPLFLSPITASLLPLRFPTIPPSLLHPIPINSTITLSLPSPSTASPTHLLVTAIDARHCPGAVMFLFRGEFGSVLYTGDWRWEKGDERAETARKVMVEAVGGNGVDRVFLDNTFCNPGIMFPSRAVAARQVVDIISQHPNHDVIIGLDSLGKEELLLYLSRVLCIKICVSPERLKTMHLLGFKDIFTTESCLTRVRVVPRNTLTGHALESLNRVLPTIGIMPTGLPWGYWGSLSSSKCDCTVDSSLAEFYKGTPRMFHRYAYVVPYSEHSCFSEILEFIKIIRPSTVTGIVSSSFCHIGVDHLSKNLTGEVKNTEAGKNQAGLLCRKCRTCKAKKENNRAVRFCVRRSRVSLLRRQRRGIKISEADCVFDLTV